MADPRTKSSEPDGDGQAQAKGSRCKRCANRQRNRSSNQATNSCTKTDAADLLCGVVNDIFRHHCSPSGFASRTFVTSSFNACNCGWLILSVCALTLSRTLISSNPIF